jgi:hypothetical protein
MADPRIFHVTTILADGTVLTIDEAVNADRRAAETYDPSSGRWTVTAGPRHARFGATVTLLPDGTVLLVGDQSHGSGRSAELYVSAGVRPPAGP